MTTKIPMTRAETMAMAFLVDHFVHFPFVTRLEFILDTAENNDFVLFCVGLVFDCKE